jgi:hypothetical protein
MDFYCLGRTNVEFYEISRALNWRRVLKSERAVSRELPPGCVTTLREKEVTRSFPLWTSLPNWLNQTRVHQSASVKSILYQYYGGGPQIHYPREWRARTDLLDISRTTALVLGESQSRGSKVAICGTPRLPNIRPRVHTPQIRLED